VNTQLLTIVLRIGFNILSVAFLCGKWNHTNDLFAMMWYSPAWLSKILLHTLTELLRPAALQWQKVDTPGILE